MCNEHLTLQYIKDQTLRASFGWGGGDAFGKFVPPLGDFNPSKLNNVHYMHAPPEMSSNVLLPPPPLLG